MGKHMKGEQRKGGKKLKGKPPSCPPPLLPLLRPALLFRSFSRILSAATEPVYVEPKLLFTCIVPRLAYPISAAHSRNLGAPGARLHRSGGGRSWEDFCFVFYLFCFQLIRKGSIDPLQFGPIPSCPNML